ncbi:ABC-type transport auxiliary lipoprotein family protein [Komagataeibacter rhaeticus]|nr:ABC-type transport auxiliary lipoprotein family protein [Komagataeibacter rhaeticus]
MLGHVLATDLQQRLPGHGVFAQNDATTVPPQGFVEVEITRFARDASGVVHLGGSLSVHRVGMPNMRCPCRLRSVPPYR